ncbi:LPXTG-motif cell wall anchor domain-containing protein/conserved repeat domain-containing protein [Micrococcales bacterium KH10]|nr:LPXTG-motif cell wall anchor domain-containing protein/conserved repeat domain-containing protein [Micrococcales bacterium KH10]
MRDADGTVPTFTPGDVFYYDLTISCTVIDPLSAGCIDATLTDPLPEPLVIAEPLSTAVTVSTNQSQITPNADTNTISVLFTVDLEDGLGNRGLPTGQEETLSIRVKVPDNLTAADAGVKRNIATMEGDNAVTVRDYADINIDVPLELSSSIGKSVDSNTPNGSPVPAVPGQPVDFSLHAANTSNSAVDALIVEDPAANGNEAFEYLALTGIDSLTAPHGADRVQFDWREEDGTWHTGTSQSIPSNPNELLQGIDLAAVYGVRFTFTNSSGLVPITGSNQRAQIEFGTQTRSNVTSIADNTTVTVNNTASSRVTLGDDSSTPVVDNANIQIRREKPTVGITKRFDRSQVPAGDSARVDLEATVGSTPIVRLTITDPADGEPDFAQQGLEFEEFITSGGGQTLEWPQGATSASIQYAYEDGLASPAQSTTTVHTLPSPDTGRRVVGFTITFEGDSIPAHASAHIPFRAQAEPVTGTNPVTSTNHTEAIVESSDGQESDPARDNAQITRQPLQIIPTLDKNIVHDEIPAHAGSSSLVSLNGALSQDSTTGTQTLVIQDPVSPGATPSDFYNHFDITDIPLVNVPVGSTLTIRYWDGNAWQVMSGAENIPGGSSYSHTLTSAERAAAQGIQFEYSPIAPATVLQPGFRGTPYFRMVLRDQWRDGSGSSSGLTTPVTVENDALTTVTNPNATDPVVTVEDEDGILLRPYPVGTGPDTVDKTWLSTNGTPVTSAEVEARTDQQRTARLLWSPAGLTASSMRISDPATDPSDLPNSIYDAFNLTAVRPITAANDPSIRFDRVSAVEYFDATAATWIDITSTVCSPASECDGQFPGWTPNATLHASILGFRITFEESPNRAARITSSLDPVVGSGVAHSTNRRPIDLVFQLRNTLRSNSNQAVLGNLHTYDYNTNSPGVVDNTVRAEAVTENGTLVETDHAGIAILDTPITVSLTKAFDAYQVTNGVTEVPLPRAGTPAGDYPRLGFTLTARNTSVSKVEQLVISDPDPSAGSDEFFERFNLRSIGAITPPPGTVSTVVSLKYANAVPDWTGTITQAQALGEVDLANVNGITVTFNGWIANTANAQVAVETRLRPTERTSGDPVTLTELDNTAVAEAVTPGGDPILDESQARDKKPVSIVTPEYGVELTKTITPNTATEATTNTAFTVALRSRPTGNVRTKTMVIEDATPTFWNAYQFSSFPQINMPAPLRPSQVRVEVLRGVNYSLSESTDPATLTATCNNNVDLSACWVTGDWQTVAANGNVTPSLPPSVTAAEVQGVRLNVRRGLAEQNWDRPHRPTVPFNFIVNRREFLRYGPNGSTTTEVPSTLPTLSPAPGETVRGRASNTAQTHLKGAWFDPMDVQYVADDDANAHITKAHLTNKITVAKSPTGNFGVTDEIPFEMVVRNTGTWTMTGLQLTDQIQTDADGSMLVEAPREVDDTNPVYTFTWTSGGTAQDTSGMSASLDPDTGELTLNLPTGFQFAPGDELRITAQLMFRPDLDPLTSVTNEITASNDRIFDHCVGQDHSDNTPAETEVFECSANAEVTSNPGAPIRVTKAVKGTGAGVLGATPGDPNYDDLGVIAQGAVPTSFCSDATNGNAGGGFFRTPCLPITRAGGTTTWRIQFHNSGNVPAGVISAIDVLPGLGDTAVLTTSQRGSRWTPTLVGNFTANIPGMSAADARIYYMTTAPLQACNRADIQNDTAVGGLPVSDPCYANVVNRNWQLLDEDNMSAAELASVRALKFVVEHPDAATGGGLAPSQTATFTWDMLNPATAERAADSDTEPLAWNSVAAGSRGIFNGDEFRINAIEPRAVGVGLAMGKIDLNKIVDTPPNWPASAPLPSTYPFALSCTSAGEDIDIFDNAATPVDRSRVDLPADGSVVHVGDGSTSTWGRVTLPLYAECSVVEDPAAQGATVTYSPGAPNGSSGTITALNDQSARSNIANPALPNPIDIQSITATNSYDIGGFEVSKSVDNGGAVNQDGDPVEYNQQVSFTAACTFGGAQVLGVADQSFTLTPGQSRTITGVPVGSECTVTESNAANAASTTVEVTQDGTTGSPTTATSASFTVIADSTGGDVNTGVAFTNHYTVGSFKITKAVSGAGASAWGAGPFEISMRCTSARTVDPVVFEDTVTLSPSTTLEWQIDNLPTDAQCAWEETEHGGANQTDAASGTRYIGTQSPTAPLEVTVTNHFHLGSVAVEKLVVGGGSSEYGDGPFTVNLACTRTVNGAAQSISIPGGATRVLIGPDDLSTLYEGLPVGAECTLTETVPGGASNSSISVTQSGGTPTVTAGTVAEFTITRDFGNVTSTEVEMTNTFNVGTLQIEKLRTGTGATDFGSGPFTVQAVCTWVKDGDTLPVALPNDGIVTLDAANGYEATITGIIASATCYVTETANGGAHETTYAPADQANPNRSAPVTIVENGSATPQASVSITNRFDTGSLRVTKQRTGAGAAVFGAGPFTAEVSCTYLKDGQTESVDLPNGGEITLSEANSYEVTLDGIIAGATCHVTETDPGFATDTTYTPAHASDGSRSGDITVVATANEPTSGPVSLGITNRFDVQGFVVHKDVDNGGAVDQDGNPIVYDETYEFTASCTYGGTELLGTDDRTFTLTSTAPGNSKAFDELPLGTTCEISEADAAGATGVNVTIQHGSDAPSAPADDTEATFTITSGSVLVTYTNEYETGSVNLTKHITGAGADLWGQGDFQVSMVCTSPLTDPTQVFSATHVLSAADPVWRVDDLPAGAECAVTEPLRGGANSSSIESGNVSDTEEITVTVGGASSAPVQVDVTNEFLVGSLRVTKAVDGPGAGKFGAGPFEVTLACTRDVDGTDVAIEIPGGAARTLDSSNNLTDVYADLPVGADCVIAETRDGGANSTSVTISDGDGSNDTTTDGTSANVTITSDATDHEGRLATVTNTFLDGALTIDKQRTGPGVEKFGAGPFTAQAVCTWVKDGETLPVALPNDGIVTLSEANGYTVTITGILPGAVCKVTETDAGLAVATSYTPADGTVTITDDMTEPVSVTITNDFQIGQLHIQKKADKKRVPAGENVTYTITVSNRGAITATDVPVTDRLPRGAHFVSASDGGQVSGRNVTWTINELTPGANTSVTVTVTYAKEGSYENVATIPTPDGPWDPSTGNDKCTDPGDGAHACAKVTVPDTDRGSGGDDPKDPDGGSGSDGDLPRTGAGAAPGLLALGMGLLGLGFVLVVVRRRRA